MHMPNDAGQRFADVHGQRLRVSLALHLWGAIQMYASFIIII